MTPNSWGFVVNKEIDVGVYMLQQAFNHNIDAFHELVPNFALKYGAQG